MSASSRPSRMRFARQIRRLPMPLLLGGAVLTVYLVVALTGPLWAPYSVSRSEGIPFAPPSIRHIAGTDQVGRDVFSRVVDGTSTDLFLSMSSTLLAILVGGSLGLLSGLLGGWFGQILMRLFDMIISIPLIILALLVIAAAGPQLSGNPWLLIGVIALAYTPRIARMARAAAVDVVTRDHVTVAKARGESAWSIVRRELLPNATGVLLVEFGVRAGYAPILVGTLGFLGFGSRPPTPEWGLMISENRVALMSSPVAVLAPSLAVAILVISLNLLTDGVARVLGRSVRRTP